MTPMIIKILSEVEDIRLDRKKKYPLNEIMLVAIGSMLCGGRTYHDMEVCGKEKLSFFKGLLPFKNGIPSEDTFARVVSTISPKIFRECLLIWMQHIKETVNKIEGLEGIKEVIGLDGKKLCGSKTKKESALGILNAFATQSGLTIASVAIERKTNEITALPDLLSLLELEGTVVTIDAAGCQKKIINQIAEQKGKFVIALKNNQKNLAEDVKTFFDLEEKELRTTENSFHETLEKGHGRIEKRSYFFTQDVNWLIKLHPDWYSVKSIGCVTSTRTIDGKKTTETRHFISNLIGNVETFAAVVRSHWFIENKLHHVLDVALMEDACQVRNRIAAENLAILRRFVLNILSRAPHIPSGTVNLKKKLSKRTMMLKAAWNTSFLETLFFSII